MKPVLLNLAVHGLDMIPGKRLVIGQAEYEAGERIQQANGSWIYPLRNLKSGYSWMVGRFQSKNQSSSDRPAGDSLRDADFGTFVMALGGFPVVQSETHDIQGGVVQIRRAIEAPPPESSFHRDLFQQGGELLEGGRWEEARRVYSDVLTRNSNHHSAMVNLAACFLHFNKPIDALPCITKAAEVEPNDPQVYQQTAVIFRALSMAGPALNALETNLNRFRWDAASWRLKASICRQFGLASALEKMLAEIDALPPERKTALAKFAAELRSEFAETQILSARCNDAIEKQRHGSWAAALEIWEVVGMDHLHSLNQLNSIICKFHLGRIEEVARESLPLLYCLPVPLHKFACVGLGLVSNANAGSREFALKLARLLSSEVKHAADLPGSPQAIFPGGEVIEAQSSKTLVDALEKLRLDPSSAQDSAMLTRLIQLYHERERNFSGNATPAPKGKPPWWKIW